MVSYYALDGLLWSYDEERYIGSGQPSPTYSRVRPGRELA
jgi:hypothetical protein